MMDSWPLEEAFVKAVHTALKLLHRERELEQHALGGLAIVEQQCRRDNCPDTVLGRVAALRRVLEDAPAVLVTENADAPALLQRRFWQGKSVVWLDSERFESESSFYARQSQAIHALPRVPLAVTTRIMGLPPLQVPVIYPLRLATGRPLIRKRSTRPPYHGRVGGARSAPSRRKTIALSQLQRRQVVLAPPAASALRRVPTW